MRLLQLRSLLEVADCGLNVSTASRRLFVSQSAVSTQLRQLEDELGAAIFARRGKKLVGLTPVGQDTVVLARHIMGQVDQLKRVREEHYSQNVGTLTVAVTFTVAHNELPGILKRFMAEFPGVSVSVRQGSPREIARLVQAGEADLCISTEVVADYSDLVMLPCSEWTRGVVVPGGHPLSRMRHLTLAAIARHRVVTYDATVDTNLRIRRAFSDAGLIPNIAVTAVDAYTLKRYVRLGLGVGIIASMAFDPRADRGLQFIDARHLFAASMFGIAIRRGAYLRGFTYRFIELYERRWTRDRVAAKLGEVAAA
jgi:LysR family cys regulon transcriptional activator